MQYYEEKSSCMLSAAMREYTRSWLVSRKMLHKLSTQGLDTKSINLTCFLRSSVSYIQEILIERISHKL